MKITNKIAIGCLVQWYEIEVIGEYIKSLKQALPDNDEVMVDFTFNINQQLEKIDDTIEIEQIVNKFTDMMDDLDKVCNNGVSFRINEDFITIADYRRWFNDEYCEIADVLMWGETDALIPKQTFEILDMLHQQVKDDTPKYLSTYLCKQPDE